MYIYHFVEVLALSLSIFYYSFLKAGCLKWLPAFLGFSCLADAIALAQGDKLHIDNIDIHYAAGIIQLLFYGNVFYTLGKRESLQKLIRVLVLAWCLMLLLIWYTSTNMCIFLWPVLSAVFFLWPFRSPICISNLKKMKRSIF